MGFRNKVTLLSDKETENLKDLNSSDKNSENLTTSFGKSVSNKIVIGENSGSAATTSAKIQFSHNTATSTNSRVNQIRGYGKKYEDAVTVTVTALLDPPPHYILRPPQSQFPLAVASFTNITNDSSLPVARPVGVAKALFKSGATIKETTPMVGTSGHPGYYTLSCRTNLGSPEIISKDIPKGLNDDEIYYSNRMANAENDQFLKSNKNNGENSMKSGVKEKKVKDKERLIMDQSARKAFEEQFRAEIALACCLPMDHITIEEVYN